VLGCQRIRRRHLNSWLLFTSWRRATIDTDAPGASVSATIRRFSASECRRFVAPGLVPSEHSSGASVGRGGLTKAGNSAARRLLIEAAWTYRFPARVSRELLRRQESQSKPIREIAWKAQLRLCARYRKPARTGKPANVVTTAIARELAGFVWAIARQVSVPVV
jgi:hypothetical protein